MIIAIIANMNTIANTSFVSPNCCSIARRVITYMRYCITAPIVLLIGLNPDASSILFISASASSFLIILLASFAMMNPTKKIMSAISALVSHCSIAV